MQPVGASPELVLPGLEPAVVTQPSAEPLDRARPAEAPDGLLRAVAHRSRPAHRAAARRGARRGRGEHVPERRDVRALRRVDSRCGHLRRADRLRAGRPEHHGAALHDPGREARVGQAHHRGHPAIPIRAAGPEGEAARADLGAPRRRHAPAGRRRPHPHDGPARGPDPGLLHDPRRPHDRDSALRAPLPRPRPDRRRRRLGVARRGPGKAGGSVRRDARRRFRADAQDAPLRERGRR